jgi:hypothetical protein
MVLSFLERFIDASLLEDLQRSGFFAALAGSGK